ncbi:MAG: hypothetical protein ACSHXK_17065, partial [Oceanococcus sp.]
MTDPVRRISVEDEQDNLAGKVRLQYLLQRYAPSDLSYTRLYKKLRLRKTEDDELETQKLFPGLPDDLASLIDWFGSEKSFSYLLETDVSKKDAGRYQPTKRLGESMCLALGWVLATSYEGWQESDPDNLIHEDLKAPSAGSSAEEFENSYRRAAQRIRHKEKFCLSKAAEIADYLLGGSPNPAQIFLNFEAGQISEISSASYQSVDDDQCRSFLQGRRLPEFTDAIGRAAIARHTEGDVVEKLTTTPQRLLLLTSAAGDGKSTVMYRAAHQFFEKGWRVLISEAWHSTPVFGVRIRRVSGGNTVLFIDGADSLGSKDGSQTLEDIRQWIADNPNLYVVLVSREIDWIRNHNTTSANFYSHIALPTLNRHEMEDLANSMHCYGAAEGNPGREELISRIQTSIGSQHYPHMLAAVMTAAQGKDFESILGSMVTNFPDRSFLEKLSLCSVCAVQDDRIRMNSGIAAFLLLRDSSLNPSDGRRKFRELLETTKSEIIPLRDSRLDLRHLDIAKYVIREAYGLNNDLVKSTFYLEDDLTAILDAAISWRGHEVHSLRVSTADHFIDGFLVFWWHSPFWEEHAFGRALYEKAIDAFKAQASGQSRCVTLLISWAILERDDKNYGSTDEKYSARWLFRKAYEINDRNLQTLNAWAILERDDKNYGSTDEEYSAHWLFKKAYEIDDRNLQTLNAWAILERDDKNYGSTDE